MERVSSLAVFLLYNILLKFIFAIAGFTPYLFEFLEGLYKGMISEDNIARLSRILSIQGLLGTYHAHFELHIAP